LKYFKKKTLKTKEKIQELEALAQEKKKQKNTYKDL